MARTTVAQPVLCEQYIKNGIANKGFSVIEILTNCHTQFGRRNNLRTPVDNLNYFKNNSISLAKAQGMTPSDLEGKIVTGEFVKREAPEYTELYRSLIDRIEGDK